MDVRVAIQREELQMVPRIWIGGQCELEAFNQKFKSEASFLLWLGNERSVRGRKERGRKDESEARHV